MLNLFEVWALDVLQLLFLVLVPLPHVEEQVDQDPHGPQNFIDDQDRTDGNTLGLFREVIPLILNIAANMSSTMNPKVLIPSVFNSDYVTTD